MLQQFLMFGAAAGGFDPNTIAGLKLWLKADAGTFQTSGGSAATADADPIGQWQDQSGQGNHVAQTTAGKRPQLKLAIQNGLPIVRWDGSDDLLTASFGGSVSRTIFAVAASRDVTAWAPISLQGANPGISFGWNGPTNPTHVYNVVNNVAFGALSSSVTTNNTFILLTGKWSGSGNVLYWNGASDATDGTTAAGSAGQTLAVGGRPENDIGFAKLDLGELLIYDAALSDVDRLAVEGYLRTRWGTP